MRWAYLFLLMNGLYNHLQAIFSMQLGAGGGFMAIRLLIRVK